MDQKMLVGIVGALTIAMVGCSSEEQASETTPSPSPSAASPAPAASPSSSPVATQPANQTPGDQPSANQVANPKPASQDLGTTPGLIQSTNADERAKQVMAGIQSQTSAKAANPFATDPPAAQQNFAPPPPKPVPNVAALPTGTKPTNVPPAPSMRPPSTAKNRNPAAKKPQPPARPTTTAQKPKGSSSSQAKAPGTSAKPSSTATKPGTNTPAAIAALPPKPSTDLANAVEVSGVITVGGVAQAIVKAPNEASSRYVSVGQRLANGKVLVKRIETLGSEPIVVLEENGVEVARAVGDKPSQSNPAGASPAV